MPFVQRVIEPKYLSRTSLFDADGKPLVDDGELEAVTNNTLSNALRQLASLVLVANDIFNDLGGQLKGITERSQRLGAKLSNVEKKVADFDPKKVAVPESDIASFALLKDHFAAKHDYDTNLFAPSTRPDAVRALYEAAAKTPIHLMRQMDRWRRDGHRSSRFFMCTPVLGAKRRKIRNRVDIDIETRMPAVIEDLRRWTSTEALGDVTVAADGPRMLSTTTVLDGDLTDGTMVSDDEAIDHKLPSPEEQLQVVALKFPAEIVAVDITGKSFDRMSGQRRSLLHGDLEKDNEDGSTIRRRTRNRKPRNRRRNTLAGTDQKEIRDALITGGEEQTSAAPAEEQEQAVIVSRSKSSDLLRSSKKESPECKKSHFNSIKEWGKNRLKMIGSSGSKSNDGGNKSSNDLEDVNIYETVTVRRKRSVDKERKTLHERKPSCSSSEKSSINIPINTPLTAAMNIASVRLRDSSAQRRLRRSGENKDEPHSSSGNWSASSESGRASIGSEITTATTQPKSTPSATTSNNSLSQHAPSSVCSRRRFNNTSTSTSEGTLTPDIIHDLHEDGETSSVYSCDTEGYYTSFHMDSGLKTLKEEDSPATPLHSTTAFSNSSSNNTVLSAENEYELFGKGSTSTTTSSAGTVCTTLRASESSRSLIIGPAVPERKSSLSKLSGKDNSPESSLERDYSSDKTGTVKRSPANNNNKATVVAVIHKQTNGDVSPDSGHNTSSSPIESISSPNGMRSGSEFEFSESSDMEGADRIERIRVKTTINSSRIPSMCVITPSQSDDESVKSQDVTLMNNNLDCLGSKNDTKTKLNLPIKPCENNNNNLTVQLINVNPQTGYATIETQVTEVKKSAQYRAPSPSGGSVTIKEKSPVQLQPIIKATLLPLNNMFGKLKLNFSNLGSRRESKSPVKNADQVDAGDYVTIADVKNNNEKVIYANDVVNRNLKTVLSGKIRETEYISLNELPCNDPENNLQSSSSADSLERKRKGARVTLNAEGKVVYSSDSLKRRKGAHTTFEPGPCVKPSPPVQSPLLGHRTPKTIRPVPDSKGHRSGAPPMVDESRPLSPQLGKVVIKASSGTSEIVRMPPSTIVCPRPMSPKPNNSARGAYVHMQEPRGVSSVAAPDEGRALSPSNRQPSRYPPMPPEYGYDPNALSKDFERNCTTSAGMMRRGATNYSTMPARKPQYEHPDRSVTPDIMRGLGVKQLGTNSMDRKYTRRQIFNDREPLHQNLGIPVQMPQVHATHSPMRYNHHQTDVSFKISPIDPRIAPGGFHSSTPSKGPELRAAANLDHILLSPKKSTMSTDELYAVIHKSKKRMNIQPEEDRGSPNLSNSSLSPVSSENSLTSKVVKPETGYLDKSKSRLSWSPNNGEYMDFNTNIDQVPLESRSRQSWACSDKKESSTSRLDFKKLLLQHGKTKLPAKKLSAVEQLQLSKQQVQPKATSASTHEVSILDLSQSPRNMRNRKYQTPNSPEKSRPTAKILSPRSQWRFPNPRSDVLSSTILEDCHEDESPNSSGERRQSSLHSSSVRRQTPEIRKQQPPEIRKEIQETGIRKQMPETTMTASQRLQAQRARFFNQTPNTRVVPQADNKPTLETSF
ncbi:PREDICTED: Nance-Horan syndrome protein isoform X1 [Nicrophorus vespilloides]|uniref:Nance-Horan syndrome protein isoform X1 n=1 Tax=Nicrophorus vespilloides TaxID=110193 RepID=A0ABM1M2N7_NICVS|nr:PREDICTED: Nance-Horan syndrome protein isoform X1 [Nicrophorus vespilloides]